MNGQLLILFIILLFAFILCTFLGGKGCIIENMENATQETSVTYYGPNNSTATIKTNSDSTKSITVTTSTGTTTTYTTSDINSNTYYGPNGATATITATTNGPSSITVTAPDGTTKTIFQTKNGATYSYDNYNHYSGTSYPSVFYGPDGGTARIIETGDGNKLVITYKDGNTDIFYVTDNTSSNININTYYGPNGSSAKIITDSNGKVAVEVTTPAGNKVLYYTDINQNLDVDTFVGPAGGTTTTVTGPYDNTAVAYSSPTGNTYVGSTTTPYDTTYYNSLPPGIPKSQIPPGDEDLYILKSQVVPPVCPRCPEPIVQCPDNFDATKCPPCPPCARCPEPAFECAKVPNYKAFNPDYMPIPVLSDFSAFGM